MLLLTPKKIEHIEKMARDVAHTRSLKIKHDRLKIEKKIFESGIDLSEEKKKIWKEFCVFNQDLQQKKAKLMIEIQTLEERRDLLKEKLC